MSFTAPDDYQVFYKMVYKRCIVYINLNYWDKITKYDLDVWLANFKNDEEKYLAALILNRLIYRNEKSILAMLSNIFFVELPQYLKKNNIFTVNDLELFDKKLYIKAKNFKNVATFRFTTITTGDLGESGHLYIKYLREYFVCNDLIIDISSPTIERYVNTIVIIDDFIGSGKQLSEFIRNNESNLKRFKHIVFMPLIAHTIGISNVLEVAREKELSIDIIPIEEISFENSFFYHNVEEDYLFDGYNKLTSLYAFYEELVESKIDIKNNKFGVGKLGLTHVFSTGVPDNNLPIIYKSSVNWTALREKR
ncbi:MAG: hypothetical protein COA66_02865 [Arcobacter sp.]|nr:MAG: hypothetical protein COA66_02865 [Arcobacter sp.]